MADCDIPESIFRCVLLQNVFACIFCCHSPGQLKLNTAIVAQCPSACLNLAPRAHKGLGFTGVSRSPQFGCSGAGELRTSSRLSDLGFRVEVLASTAFCCSLHAALRSEIGVPRTSLQGVLRSAKEGLMPGVGACEVRLLLLLERSRVLVLRLRVILAGAAWSVRRFSTAEVSICARILGGPIVPFVSTAWRNSENGTASAEALRLKLRPDRDRSTSSESAASGAALSAGVVGSRGLSPALLLSREGGLFAFLSLLLRLGTGRPKTFHARASSSSSIGIPQ
mmetsp:Transcript_60994/g.106127  ORF Transcript_60994/g.106127 Transcript_60994/m.106127 type:complete len:281 (+) Transcript_60994:1-843(+)